MARGGLAALVLWLACLGLVPAPPSGAAVRSPGLAVQPGRAIAGELVVVRGRLPTRIARPVVLQRDRGTGWQSAGRTRSARTGAVTARYRAAAGATRLRLLAPGVRLGGRWYPRVVTRAVGVVGAPQTVAVAPTRDAGGSVDLRLRLSHARPGRPVTVQARAPGGRWAQVARRALGPHRSLTLPDVATTTRLAGHDLRVVLAARDGAPALTSATIPAPGVTDSVLVRDGGFDLAATTTGAVDTVRFFVDGELVAEDRTRPWSTRWEGASGVHDVVVRAIGPQGSVLTAARSATVPAPVVGVDSGVVEGFTLETVQSGLDLPTSAAAAPSGIVLVTEKAGTVQVLEPDGAGGYAPPREVLDLTAEVYDDLDAGLIGIAVDPGFAVNGYVYLSLVRDDDAAVDGRRTQQVVRFTWDGGALDPASRHVVLGSVTGAECSAQAEIRTPDCVPLIGGAHTIGDLRFDPQGRLLVGVGDGALYGHAGLAGRPEALRAQDPEVLAGKVLRVDPVTGRGVPDNPLYTGDGSSNASRVLALGFRNPFRFTLRDGVLVVGDVGEVDLEELDTLRPDDVGDVVPNFGWPCLEGEQPTDLGDVADPASPWHGCAAVRASGATVAPAHVYRHVGPGGSVSGGAFLDDVSYPDGWRGRYVFGDYARNRMWTADVDGDGSVSGVVDFASSASSERPVSFFTGPDGLVWSVAIATGSLRRIRYLGTAPPDRCAPGTFRRSFHDLDGPDSAYDREYPDGEYRWLYPSAAVQPPTEPLAEPTCVDEVRLLPTSGSPWSSPEEPDQRAHPGDRFATRWHGRVDLEAGTYRFAVQGSEWIRVWVDDDVVHDFYADEWFPPEAREHDVVLGRGQHTIRVEHLHGDAEVARAAVTWSRVGAPPTVVLDAPANGHVVGGAVPWSITVSDPDGDDVAALADAAVLAVDFLHYNDGEPHVHPETRIRGSLSGLLSVDDAHAPGSGVVRLRASVTDASGASTTSAPVYVCFPDGAVGPCAD